MRIGVFVSDTLYYVAGEEVVYYKDSTTTNTILQINGKYAQGVIFASDSTLTSCYSIQTTPASSPVTLATLSITALATPIYGPSTTTFVSDSTSTSVNAVMTTATSISSWCASSTPTFSSVSSS
jgi:hypothetical protein